MIYFEDLEILSNSEEYRMVCPKCSHNRKSHNKKDPCLAVNTIKKTGKCWNCEEIVVSKGNNDNFKNFDLPKNDWENHTSLSDEMVKYCSGRGISQNTLIDCKITEEMYYQPAHQKEVNNIVFNYFTFGKLVNKKYRSGGKKFMQTKNARKVFYGIDDVKEKTYIVEGEFDKLALWEVGFKNCISVPNGANDLNDVFEHCESQLKQVKEFIICVDKDEAGQKLEDALTRRLGKQICKYVEFPKGIKDANDFLKSDKLGLIEALEKPIEYPVEGTYQSKDVLNELLDTYDKGLEQGYSLSSQNFNEFNQLSKLSLGQLTTVTGIPSHGKSTFVDWYLLNVVNEHDLKVCYYSPEHSLRDHNIKLVTQFTGKPFFKKENRVTKDEIKTFTEWSEGKFYFTSPDNGERFNWKNLLLKFKEQLFRFGIHVFVIDAFNKVRPKNGEITLGEIADVLGELTVFCQHHNVHIFLIAHPTKMPKEEDGQRTMPDLYNVKGSGDFADQTHNAWVVHRDFNRDVTIVKNLKQKFNWLGEQGKEVNFIYNNERYYSQHSNNWGKNSLLKFETKEIKPNLEFEEDLYSMSDSECPF